MYNLLALLLLSHHCLLLWLAHRPGCLSIGCSDNMQFCGVHTLIHVLTVSEDAVVACFVASLTV